MQVQSAFRSLAITALLLCGIVPARALECPVPHPQDARGTLQETPAQIAEYSSILGNGDTGNAVSVVISELRRNHPDATASEIVNFLVAAYCPALAEQGYGGEEAARKIRDFTALVEARLLDYRKKPAETAAQSG